MRGKHKDTMSVTRLLILLLLVPIPYQVRAQALQELQEEGAVPQVMQPVVLEDLSGRSLHIGDTVLLVMGNCKNTVLSFFARSMREPSSGRYMEKGPSLVKVHGNITYNFSYRSYIDTPFAQNDLNQHLVQTSLNFLIKDRYPLRLTVTNRSSNSPYFRNTTDVNLQFNRRQLLDNIKTDLRSRVSGLVHMEALQRIEDIYDQKQLYADRLQAWVNSPARLQELVEEREKALRMNGLGGALPGLAQNGEQLTSDRFSSLLSGKGSKALLGKVSDKVKDTLMGLVGRDSSYKDRLDQKKQELAKLKEELKSYHADAKQLKKAVLDSVNDIKKQINNLNSPAGLYAFMQKNGIAKKELTSGQRLLLSINEIGIGRSWVDHSELTVKNVSLVGVNIAANPFPFYVAFAAGKVNYGFREFILKDRKELPDQRLYLIRAGVGQKERNNLIFSFYNGNKAVLNYTASNDAASVQHVLGISAEGRFVVDENNYIIAEVARSSFANAGTSPPSSELMGKVFNLKDRSNEAYSIKLYSQVPQTDTRVTGYYKSIGENFQSFNLYPINIKQDAWMVKVGQALWKKRLVLDAAIRKNDLVSPIAVSSFSNKTVFRSFQASLRVPRYPFLSVGYYPSSQLSLVNDNVLVENQYNTLNALLNHSYQFRKIGMNTNVLFTKFYNGSSDTGFIYYNASSWTVNHSIYLSPFLLQSSVSLTEQKDLHLFTLEQLLSYQYKNVLTLSGSLKWNRLNHAQTLMGGTATMSITVKKLGTVQLNYDKTFLPSYNSLLRAVDIGRLAFYREF